MSFCRKFIYILHLFSYVTKVQKRRYRAHEIIKDFASIRIKLKVTFYIQLKSNININHTFTTNINY